MVLHAHLSHCAVWLFAALPVVLFYTTAGAYGFNAPLFMACRPYHLPLLAWIGLVPIISFPGWLTGMTADLGPYRPRQR
jgi:hypothetical protein